MDEKNNEPKAKEDVLKKNDGFDLKKEESKPVEEVKREEPIKKEVKVEPKKEEPKIEVKKKPTIEDEIEEIATKMLKSTRDKGEMWATMAEDNRNFFNSADEARFFLTKGRCEKLPNPLTPILAHALSEANPLLREATEEEMMHEFRIRAEEHLISIGKLKPKKIEEEGLVL